jgi:hypothetical protein
VQVTAEVEASWEAWSITIPPPLYRTLQRAIAAHLLPAHNHEVVDAGVEMAEGHGMPGLA